MNRRGTEPYARWCERTGEATPPPTRSRKTCWHRTFLFHYCITVTVITVITVIFYLLKCMFEKVEPLEYDKKR